MATATMDGTPRAMAAAARFARIHASRDTGACRPTSCLKLSGQTVCLWPQTTAWQRLLESRSTGDGGTTCAGAWIARPAPWRQRHASHGPMLAVTPGLSADQLLENECTNVRRREHVTAPCAAAPSVAPLLWQALRCCMDGPPRAMAAKARFAQFHAATLGLTSVQTGAGGST